MDPFFKHINPVHVSQFFKIHSDVLPSRTTDKQVTRLLARLKIQVFLGVTLYCWTSTSPCLEGW